MIEIRRQIIQPGAWVAVSEAHSDVLLSLGPTTRAHFRVAIAATLPTPGETQFMTLWERTDPMLIQGIDAGLSLYVFAEAAAPIEILRGALDA